MKRLMYRLACLLLVVAAALLVSSCNSGSRRTFQVIEVEHDSLEVRYTPALELGSEAPDFSVLDNNNREVVLSDYSGRYVVLLFWASWCSDCRNYLPEIKKVCNSFLGKKIHGYDLSFIGVSFDHDADKWHRVIDEEQFRWKQCCNFVKWRENKISKDYGISWIPTSIIISPEGRYIGFAITPESLRRQLELL